MHNTQCDGFVVHISVLLIKQNICRAHKTNVAGIGMIRYIVSIS